MSQNQRKLTLPLLQPELAHPYDVFVKAGAELAFASPQGGVAPLDPVSVDMFKDDSSVNFLNNHKNLWETTKPLSEFTDAADKFDAVFCTYNWLQPQKT